MTSAQILIIVTIILYMVGMLAIGALFNRKGATETSDGFYIGGRSLGPVVTAMSAEASDMSSYLLMGLPGLAYIAGLAEVTWTAVGLSIGTYLNFLLVARLLRRYSERIGAFTIPDFYARRYRDDKHILSCIAAVIILVFFIPYTASGFKAVGTMFNSLFGFNYHVAMIVGALIIIAYTTMGGFLAVSTTDLVQSVFMSRDTTRLRGRRVPSESSVSCPHLPGALAILACLISFSDSWESEMRKSWCSPAGLPSSGS